MKKTYLFFITLVLSFVIASPIANAQGTLKIYPGWNLVDYNVIDGMSIPEKNIRAIYLYKQGGNEYLGGNFNAFRDVVTNLSSNTSNRAYIEDAPVWVYYDGKEMSINLKESVFFQAQKRLLAQSWNFVSFTNELSGKSLAQVKGDCNIEKVYNFNANTQEWQRISGNGDMTGQTFVFKDWSNYLGSGLLVKVTNNNCTLNFSESSTASQIPNLPN